MQELLAVREEVARQYRVSPAVHDEDLIWRFVLQYPTFANPEAAIGYYFSDGAESARKLQSVIGQHLPFAGSGRKLRLLEFASGYGMVTRHLASVLGGAELIPCDIHQQAVDFIRDQLGQAAVLSRHAPEEVVFDQSFDVVFALSFFSHMPEATFSRWLAVPGSSFDSDARAPSTMPERFQPRLMHTIPWVRRVYCVQARPLAL